MSSGATPIDLGRYDFHEPLSPDDFGYYHSMPRDGELVVHTVEMLVKPAFEEVKSRFGITVEALEWGEVPPVDKAPYILVGPVNPLLFSRRETDHLRTLGQLPNARINILPAFPYTLLGDDTTYRQKAAQFIPEIDRSLGVNTIFADEVDALYHGLRTISARDIADNVVCETIRLKYDAVRDKSEAADVELADAHEEAGTDIAALSAIYRDYGLYHRSATDGAFLIHTDGGWLTTQTKTDKTAVLPDNMSLVRAYSTDNNQVQFAGTKLPSSDIPEFLVTADYLREAFDGYQDIRLVAHFHHNPTTRGGKLPTLETDFIEYGNFSSGQQILEAMKHRGDNGLILKQHGVVWFGSSVEEFEDYVAKRLGIPKISQEES